MIKKHLFICTNGADRPGKCGIKNSENLRSQLKDLCKKQSWSSSVRVNSAGCLGTCEKGISAVLYPEGKWFFHLTESDVQKLYTELESVGVQNS